LLYFYNTLKLFWSGIRGSNSRPIPWQGIALPTELIPHQKNSNTNLLKAKPWSV